MKVNYTYIKIIDFFTSIINKNKNCNCGSTQYKLISTSKSGKYKGKKPICKNCHWDLIKD